MIGSIASLAVHRCVAGLASDSLGDFPRHHRQVLRDHYAEPGPVYRWHHHQQEAISPIVQHLFDGEHAYLPLLVRTCEVYRDHIDDLENSIM